MQPIASLRSWGWPSNSCFLLAKPVRPRKLSGEFVASGTFWTYLCCLVMFHPVQKSWCFMLKSGAGSILHQWRGGDPRDMRQAWPVAQSGLGMAWKVWEIGLIWLHSPLYHGWVWVVRFWQCIFKYLKARICKFGVVPFRWWTTPAHFPPLRYRSRLVLTLTCNPFVICIL